MSQAAEFHRLGDVTQGSARELAPVVTRRNFPGEQAMLFVVAITPNGEGTRHSHSEAQRGVVLEGSAIRIQGGEEIAVAKGDFWRTPGGVPHTIRAGPEGCQLLDIFAPPRGACRAVGKDFSTT